jgi:hypothetical protein
MHTMLQQEEERLLRTLSDEGVELGHDSRTTITEHFEGAAERFVPDREGVERLRENTDLLAEALVDVSEDTAVETGEEYGAPEGRPTGSRGGRRRSLRARDVTDVFTKNCIWPFCDEDDLGR